MWPCCGLMRLLQTFLLFIAPIYGHYQDGDIRLVRGSYQWEGRVEIYFSGTWGTITDSDWTSDDAQVVCRKLGHFKPGASSHSDAYFGEGSGMIHLTFVNCSGSEYDIGECETKSVGISSSHSLDVGVKCLPAYKAYRKGDIRLVGGSYNWEGRVEIYWSGTWGAISDSSWTVADASVVCRQLQHSDKGVEIPCCDLFGEGSGPIHINNVACVGSEANITDCNYLNNTVTIINHQQDVLVQCQQGDEVKEWDIRLVEGKYPWEGRVEIYLYGDWGTVSDDWVTSFDAAVVCRQLGYNTHNAGYSCCAQFGQGTGPIHIAELACSGSEYRIRDCQYNSFTLKDTHSEDWSVYCDIDAPESGDARFTYTRCNLLSPEHHCQDLSHRVSNFTLPQFLSIEADIYNIDAQNTFNITASLRGLFPDACLDVVEHYICTFVAPPCDPESGGLPMKFCELDCVAYAMLKKEGACKDTIKIIRDFALTAKNFDLIQAISVLENFDCKNVATYHFVESNNYAETCTGLLSEEFLVDVYNDSSFFSNSVVSIFSVTTILCLVVVCCIILILCVRNKSKVKRCYEKWTLSSKKGSSSHGVENPVELSNTDYITYAEEIISKPPALIHNETSMSLNKCVGEEEGEVKLSAAEVKEYEAQFSQLVVQFSNFQLNECIGKGAFGKVFEGVLNDPDRNMVDVTVAIKTIKNIHSKEQLSAFLAESLIMKDFHHPHILGLLGVCFDAPDGSPYIILPFMANGSVKDYLKEKRAHVLDVNSIPMGLSLEILAKMCLDIAEGMTYLADKRFVHRDLAARNCMLDSHLSVLVGDFGLARDIYSTDYYRAGEGASLPVKWMPPESLTDNISTEKTDVWSYGVTCWEVFSLGCSPYPGIENHEILEHISGGERLKKPALCPDKLYEIIGHCWQYLPDDRPTFEEILINSRKYWNDARLYVVQT